MANPVKVEITGDASSLLGALNQSTVGLRGFAKDVDGVGASLAGMVKNLTAPLAALAGLVGGASFLKSAVSETVNWTVQAQKLARAMGITTEQASAWGVAIKGVHGDTDTFLTITAKMTRTLNSNEDAFHKLGVATRDSQGHLRGTQDVLLDTFQALSQMKEGTDRNVASSQIFGRGWMEVAKYLKLNKEALAAAREEAARLNLVVGGDSVAAANAYRKSSEDLDLTIKGLKIRIGQELLPAMTLFNETAAEDGPSAISILGNSLKGLVELVDGAWSGFKMFSIGLVGLMDSACRYVITALSTAWGFLSAGIPGARKAWQEGNQGIKEDWQATLDAMNVVGEAYMQRQGQRWEGWGVHAKGTTAAPAPAGGFADTQQHREKKAPENEYESEKNKLRAEGLGILDKETLAQKEAAEVAKAGLELEEQKLRYAKQLAEKHLTGEQAAALGRDADQEYVNKVLAIHEKIGQERVKIDADTLGKIDVFEKSGVEKRVEEARKEFAAVNEERRKAGLQAVADSVLQGKLDQIDTSRQSGSAGAVAGGQDYLKKSGNAFDTWRSNVSGVLGSVQQSFAQTFTNILTKGMSFSTALISIWKGLTQAVIGALMQMAARQIVNWGVEKLISAWKLTDAKAQVAAKQVVAIQGAALDTQATASTVAASTAQTGAAETSMAAKIYAWYSSMGPWAIPAAAATIAGVILAISQIGKITAHASGGVIDGPTLALMGEIPGSREIVAPETSFKNWAGNLTANIVAQERQAQAYQAQGGQYASAAASQGSLAGYGTVQVDLSGAVIAGESVESARIIGNLVKKHLDAYNRRNG